jgi:hypothetical protein
VTEPRAARTGIPLRYDPHRAQRKFHRAARNARFVVACAGRRGGKTQGGAAEFARRLVADLAEKIRTQGPWRPTYGADPTPFLRYGVVAPTYALLNEPKMALQRYLGHVADGGIVVKQGLDTWWAKGGVRIDFLSGDRPERLVSHAYHGLWLEEAARMKAAVWVDNLRPTLSDWRGWAIFTTTPLGKNWFWEEVWARCDAGAAAELATLRSGGVVSSGQGVDPEYVGVTWTTAENDAIPALAEEMERAERQMPRAMFLRNYYASFESFVGQLFAVSERHLAHGPPPAAHVARRAYAGGDLGTTHPSSFTLIAEDADRVWHEVATVSASDVVCDSDREWDRRDALSGRALEQACWTVQVYRMLYAWARDGWRNIKLFLPADRPDVKRLFRARGFRVADAYQEHEPAVSYFQALLHADRFRFRSLPLFRCCQGLRVPERGERSSKLWVDVQDDQWDGLRYAFSDIIRGGESPLRGSYAAMNWVAR